jgi:hypothetical protein
VMQRVSGFIDNNCFDAYQPVFRWEGPTPFSSTFLPLNVFYCFFLVKKYFSPFLTKCKLEYTINR